MRNIVLPLTRAQAVYKIESPQEAILFDPMTIVGNSERTSLRPNQWSYINNIQKPNVTVYSKTGGALFVDIFRLENDPGLEVYKNQLLEMAKTNGLVEKTNYHMITWKDGDVELGATYHRNYSDALAAAHGNEEAIFTKEGWVGTPKLAEKIGVNEELLVKLGSTYGLIGTLQHLSEHKMVIDGIYWSEEYESNNNMTEMLSIFPHKTPLWTQSPGTMPQNDGELISLKSATFHHVLYTPQHSKAREIAALSR
ncbi:MAG: hypothetical protein RSG77_17875 [Hafnia sp.]